MPHVISTSGRKSYRGCRRRWDWLFNGYYYPKTTAKPLEFGIAYHKAMEIYYAPAQWGQPREVMAALAIQEFIHRCEKQRAICLANKDEVRLEPEVQKDYDERVQLGIGMLKYHLETIAPVADIGFKPLKVELRAQIPITNPDTGEILRCMRNPCSHSPEDNVVEYVIRIDCLAEDTNGDYWIVDWKTAARINEDGKFLELDDQIGSYVWVFRSIGVPVRGFLYHEQKKAYPMAPNENAHVRKGCLFSVSKTQDTDYETYRAHVAANDSDAYENGYYNDFLFWLQEQGVTYHKRFQVHKSDRQIASIGQNIYQEAFEMVNPATLMYPSPGRFSCDSCAFRTPCIMRENGEDYKYTLNSLFEKRKIHYYDAVESSTDNKAGK